MPMDAELRYSGRWEFCAGRVISKFEVIRSGKQYTVKDSRKRP
jgi:hypothetical protein